jgi:hypothetical protein
VTFAALLGEEAPVVCLRYENYGQSRPGKAGNRCPAQEVQVASAADNAPFDVTAWRRTYTQVYRRSARGYSMDRTGGVLRPAVEAYLQGGEMTSTELMALQAYLKRSIMAPNWRGKGVEDLRERVEDLDTRKKLGAWLDDALDIGIDPL